MARAKYYSFVYQGFIPLGLYHDLPATVLKQALAIFSIRMGLTL